MERWYRASGVATRTIVRTLGVRLHYAGLENGPRTGPVVLASTHVSYPDFLWIGLAAHERDRWVRFLTRHDVWRGTVARAMDGMRHVPVDPPRGQHAPWCPAHLGGHAPDRREALDLDHVPPTAVPPTWGPPTIEE